jgi:O-antigen ligase
VKPAHVRSLVSLYGRFVPLFIAWVPVFALIGYGFPQVVPITPGTNVPIAFFKAGDLAVHLAGAAAFVLAGLYPTGGWRGLVQPFLWAVWLAGFGVIAVLSRGGMLAVAAVSTLILFVRSPGRWAVPTIVGLTLIGLAGITNVEIDIGKRREVSAAQLVENIQSVLGESDDPGLADTREWREAWWAIIIGYTVEGPYLWEGKGFGINLADDDGFQISDESLRAPHNAHLNLLARSGLPGLALWLAVQVAFALTLLRAARAAARSERRFWLAILAWIFVYWLAALLNMSFDVYLEGPQGGILFWSLIGLGLAAASCIREEEDKPPARSVAVAPRKAASAA